MNKKRTMLAAAIVLWALALPRCAFATNYYVDGQEGDNSLQGTSDHPFRSLDYAVSRLAPGDTLFVIGRRYDEPLIIAQSGTEQLPIGVVGKNRPVIESPDDAIKIVGSYITISGFEAHSAGEGSAILVGAGSHHVRITDNVARDAGCSGIGIIRADYVTIEGNKVFGNSRRSPWQCSGISIYQAINVDQNTGIHNYVRDNLVYDNMNVVVDDGITHSNGKTTDGNGIIVDDGRHTQGNFKEPPYDGSTVIENNIIFDNGGRGINVFLSDHVFVRNNTNYHNLKDPNLAFRQLQGEFAAAYAGDVRFVNNIAVPRQNDFFGFSGFKTENVTWDFNLLAGGTLPEAVRGQPGWGEHNVIQHGNEFNFIAPSIDPKTADFHLRQSSGAIGAGSAADAPRYDFENASRSSSVDLGALQASPSGVQTEQRVK
jgi:hypothetical protein